MLNSHQHRSLGKPGSTSLVKRRVFGHIPASQDLRFVAHLMTRKHRNRKIQTSSSQFIHTPIFTSQVKPLGCLPLDSLQSLEILLFQASHDGTESTAPQSLDVSCSFADGGVPHPQMGPIRTHVKTKTHNTRVETCGNPRIWA